MEIHTSKAERKIYQVTKEMVTIKRYEKVMHVEEFVPSVVEPSFGIGRIMYGLFEHRLEYFYHNNDIAFIIVYTDWIKSLFVLSRYQLF